MLEPVEKQVVKSFIFKFFVKKNADTHSRNDNEKYNMKLCMEDVVKHRQPRSHSITN